MKVMARQINLKGKRSSCVVSAERLTVETLKLYASTERDKTMKFYRYDVCA